MDEIGGLEKALAFTKNKAGLPPEAKIVEYPAPKELAEQLSDWFSGERRPVASLRSLWPTGVRPGPLTREMKQVQGEFDAMARLNDPMGAYARLPFELQIK